MIIDFVKVGTLYGRIGARAVNDLTDLLVTAQVMLTYNETIDPLLKARETQIREFEDLTGKKIDDIIESVRIEG